jgi:hypothetical protein
MVDSNLWKSWKVTEARLRHAFQGLPQPAKENYEEFHNLLHSYENYLEHNELELALDALEELGHLVLCRGSFWRNLERAAENMELTERASRLHEKFLETV